MDPLALAFNPYRTGSDSANEDLISVARLADDLGYHTFFAGESWGMDALTVLTAVGVHLQGAAALYEAITMPQQKRQEMSSVLTGSIIQEDITHWITRQLEDIAKLL